MTLLRPRGGTAILAAALAALGVAGLGALMTDLGPWYQQLHVPDWKPPDWLFGPAWTLIFGLTALAGATAWTRARRGAARAWILWLFGLNILLNLLWSLLFFRLRHPDWALIEVGFLWLSILLLIYALAPVSRLAGWLLAPYLAWVTFAATLNFAVWQLNAPFR